MAFLVQEVVRQPSAKRGRKSAAQIKEEEEMRFQRYSLLQENPQQFESIETLKPEECLKGVQSVKGYVTSIVDLWEKVNTY